MRYEYKYLIKKEKLNDFKNEIYPYLMLDNFADSRIEKEYVVRSIYLDTIDLDFYHEKIEGLKVRKKLRIRGYNSVDENDIIFLEIKRKYGPKILKNRAPLQYDNLPKLLSSGNLKKYIITGNGHKNKINDGSRFFHNLHRNSLSPTVLVVYNREPYFSKFNPDLRITIDKSLRYNSFPCYGKLFDEDLLVPAMPNHFVVEVKFSRGFPTWLQHIIRRYHVSRRPVSKYTICIDSNKHLKLSRRKTIISLLN